MKRIFLFPFIFLLICIIFSLFIVLPRQLTLSLPSGKVKLSIPVPSITIFGHTYSAQTSIKQGIDLQGGTEVTLAADMSGIPDVQKDQALESAKAIITRRIDLYGVSEPQIQTSRVGNLYRLLVEIPGTTNISDALALIGSTAQLDFREYKPTSVSKSASISGLLVSDFVPTGLTGKDLQQANVQYDPQTALPNIGLQFTQDGAQKFAKITGRNIGKPLAIFLDGYPITSPTVQTQITNGQAQITGQFTADEAKSLVITLNAGALPVPIQVIEQRTLGASLGSQTVTRSIRAGVIGVGIVMLFMVLIYGWKGFLSVISLCVYGLFTLALYKLIPVTLTLAGIAGFLLSMGMAVDTNILVFERLREEERKGGNVDDPHLLDCAFGRAWNSIKDANFTTLMTSFILYNPLDWDFLNHSGTVRGFALTLALGIVLNILCGMVITRLLLQLFYTSKPNTTVRNTEDSNV